MEKENILFLGAWFRTCVYLLFVQKLPLWRAELRSSVVSSKMATNGVTPGTALVG